MSALASILASLPRTPPPFDTPPSLIVFNTPPKDAQVILLLEQEHGNARYGAMNAQTIDEYSNDGDLVLVEGENDPSSAIYQLTIFKIHKKLQIKSWEDPEEIKHSNEKVDQIMMSQLSDWEKDREIDDYIRSSFSRRQDRLIKQISSHLASPQLKGRKIFVIAGSQHGDLSYTVFFDEVEKLIKSLTKISLFCIFNPARLK